MRRFFTPPPARRPTALARAVAVGGALALLAGLLACGSGAPGGSVRAPSAAASAVAQVASEPLAANEIPPPPLLSALMAAAPASAAAAGDLDTVRAQLESTLGQAASCKVDADCRSVATGAKACGGPTSYRAYSATAADASKVEELARRERELAALQARESGRVSACFMLADPGAHCEKSACVTGPAGTN